MFVCCDFSVFVVCVVCAFCCEFVFVVVGVCGVVVGLCLVWLWSWCGLLLVCGLCCRCVFDFVVLG